MIKPKYRMRQWINLIEAIQVWHGSPHNLETFSTDHIGNGEGHAAYGWGLYFAAEKKVADYYHYTLNTGVKYRGVPIEDDDSTPLASALHDIATHMIQNRLSAEQTIPSRIEELRDTVEWQSKSHHRWLEHNEAKLSAMTGLNADDFTAFAIRDGRLYTASIPDGPYLNWDKPFSEQSPVTKKALRAMRKTYGDYLKYAIEDDDTGEIIYRSLGNHNRNDRGIRDAWDKQSSLDLLAHGIIGIAYLDEESREAGRGTMNYVLFDGASVTIKQ